MASCVAFWTQCVIPRIQPVETAPDRVSIPKYDGKISDLSDDDDFAALCTDYDELKAMSNEAAELVDQAAERIKSHLGEIQAAECSGYRVYYSAGKPRVTLDSTRLKKDMPEVYEKYAKTGEASRSFRFYQVNQ
ncbi:hypothetical protein SDC9_168569 [bioreactor metagenome]|uniref:Uncharacterized protein n=1 Tax=bioreactor metagenome TaxID=1076179 RepID=A0A645G5J1_9ZZZZ